MLAVGKTIFAVKRTKIVVESVEKMTFVGEKQKLPVYMTKLAVWQTKLASEVKLVNEMRLAVEKTKLAAETMKDDVDAMRLQLDVDAKMQVDTDIFIPEEGDTQVTYLVIGDIGDDSAVE